MTHFKKIAASIIAVGFISVTATLIAVSAKTQNNLVIGNFHSYMSPDVQHKLRNKYGVSYDYYGSNETIKLNLKNNQFDIFIPTIYELVNLIQDNLVRKIDWAKFNIPNAINPTSALNLFTPATQKILSQTYDLDNDGTKDNLLEYCVPYFLQSLIFMYRGDKIPSLDKSKNPTWNDILNVVVSDKRFYPNTNTNFPNLAAISDSRTLYSIPRLIQTNDTDLNPQPNAEIGQIDTTYNILSSKLQTISGNQLLLSEDSNVVLNKIAKKEVMGAILYNGDAAFASQGGDSEIKINEKDIHIVKPKMTLAALDVVAMSNSDSMTQKQIDMSYNIIKDLTYTDKTNIVSSLAYENFDYVLYTPTLNSIFDYVNKKLTTQVADPYWYNQKLLKEILEVSENNLSSEQPLSKLTKSNFRISYMNFRNNLN